ncbi:MAG: glycoside hydrolase family 1 protein [Acidimicrobiia bacterium]|nr:glycoside hydrolase family 1 protein [Acidimicrobiia bacterium]
MSYSFPDGFVWGTATAAHQVEGGTWNNDWWAFEHQADSGTVEPAGDACDHYWRYPSDIALLADLGFGAYRFSLEWSRIEPEAGEFSVAALDHYRRMCATTLDHGLIPVVTFHHFTTPRWAVTDGGWTDPAIVDRFARFCERSTAHLGDLIGMATTINEPNIVSLMGHMVGAFPPGHHDLGEYALANDHLRAAHRKGYDAIKAGPGHFPVGSTVAMGDWWAPEGSEAVLESTRWMHEGQHLEAAAGDDFIGVQAYSRTRLGADGMPTGPEEGVETLIMGYEYWPDALEVSIRSAASITGSPVMVTENGIGTTDDEQRVRYVTDALGGLTRCLDDGIDVRGYFYWSLLDNFEWALGYGPQFGLIGVDRDTQARTVKASAEWLGAIARANRLP